MNPSRSKLSRRTVLGGAVIGGAGAVLATSAFASADPAVGNGVQDDIDDVTAELESGLIALRRDLHAHAEPSGEERRTAATVAKRLRAAGLTVKTGIGGFGVVGVLKGAKPGRTVAYRADMDAVSPEDQVGGGTKVEHLCGHDIHTTVGVGVAEVLARLRKRLHGTVVFVFQPAEESLAGARAMLDDGVLKKYRPKEIHALHCGPMWAGQFGVLPGTGMAGQDRPRITLTGPDAAAQAERLVGDLMGLSTVGFPENPADLEQLVEDMLTPDGPLERFVTLFARASEPDADGKVTVQAGYRAWPDGRNPEIRERVAQIAASYDGAEVSYPEPTYPAMIVPEKDGHAVKRHLRRVFGDDAVLRVYAPVPFSGEDFAYFLNEIPGTYSYLGVGKPDAGIETSYPHFGSFDPDEKAIAVGVRGMAGWLAKRCRD
ncbi:M20 metallopeptidase family protein [Stackebrandtia nassauensis]|uniref:Amidohydrolase n=1 Tax=Stackebrandtia nassauensis (strain DSM 44728 / CIP 108903 / NRRL B-16338 / NBRC 102104 / LLR-40K-21) TaxID=446470 RepID=D3PYE6_STANL|nr:M20/M25/M40 family metallo-hydrolase [Stackebrandtia nassauensis]ADD41513.1 amidohydrolase [Stackebrandtia nassauensis DSM 44728]